MKLVEQGKIDLDAPVSSYIPEFGAKSRFQEDPITVRDLLTHQSGLISDYGNGFLLGQVRMDRTDTAYRTVPSLLRETHLARPPRTATVYCNLGFSLLGIIIERVTGVSYADFIQDSLFGPLMMKSSAVVHDDERVRQSFSRGYFGKESVDAPFIRDIPAGSLVSSADDLGNFLRMILNRGSFGSRQIFSSGTIESMWQPQNENNPLDFDFRMGLTYFLSNPTTIPQMVVYHGGDLPPYHSLLAAIPNAKLGIVVMVNSTQGSQLPTSMAFTLLEKFYEAKTGKDLPSKAAMKPHTLSGETMDRLSGLYASSLGLLEVHRTRNDLKLTFAGIPLVLTPVNDTTVIPEFKVLGVPLMLDMLKDASITVHTIQSRSLIAVRIRNTIVAQGERITPKETHSEWKNRKGNYQITLSDSAQYTSKKLKAIFNAEHFVLDFGTKLGILVLHRKGSPGRVPLMTLSASEALTSGVGRGSGETISGYEENGSSYLRVSGFTLKKVSE